MTEAERIARTLGAALPQIKAGTLRFWGCWFGRPYDNIHQIRTASAEGDVLVVTFSDDEVLTVWAPNGPTVAPNRFEIRDASRVRWEWYSYGRPKVLANRYFQEFRRAGDISVATNVDWYQPTFDTDASLPAVELL